MDGLIGRIAYDIGKIAPALGSVLASPFAGIGLSLLSDAFGIPAKDMDKLEAAIIADPMANAKLTEIEIAHSEALAKLNSADYATEVDDRKSARQREVALQDHVPFILAMLFLCIYAAVQAIAVFYPAPGVDLISARVQDILVMIVSYFFGSMHKKRPSGIYSGE